MQESTDGKKNPTDNGESESLSLTISMSWSGWLRHVLSRLACMTKDMKEIECILSSPDILPQSSARDSAVSAVSEARRQFKRLSLLLEAWRNEDRVRLAIERKMNNLSALTDKDLMR